MLCFQEQKKRLFSKQLVLPNGLILKFLFKA
jgi:hypothetical protein